MLLESIISITSLSVGIFLCVILIYLLHQYKNEKGSTFFLMLIISILVWAAAFMFEMIVSSENLMMLFAKIQYIGVSFVPVAWFSFCSIYAGKFDNIVRGRLFYLLTIIPILTIILVFTNESHGLIWSKIDFSNIGVFKMLTPIHGTWFWIHTTYSYLLIATGSLLIIWKSLSISSTHIKRSILLISAVVLPWVANMVYLLKMTGFDYTVLTSVASISLLFLGVYGYKLVNVIPIARNIVIEGLDDAVVVLDENYRVVDMNPSAERLLEVSTDKAIGLGASQVFDRCPEIIRLYKSKKSEKRSICIKEKNGVNKYYAVKASPLYDKSKRVLGKLIVIRDITEIKQTENELKEKIEELERYKKVTVGRELKMIELKKQIEEFQRKLSGGDDVPVF
ncbi:MAG TPA: PAS domain S-box protein [Thermoplasmatales archaeon]|nr:PAS domain S-box protein [Thermoplasmatales archaeon]